MVTEYRILSLHKIARLNYKISITGAKWCAVVARPLLGQPMPLSNGLTEGFTVFWAQLITRPFVPKLGLAGRLRWAYPPIGEAVGQNYVRRINVDLRPKP